MFTKYIYDVYDSVSESWLGDFLAVNDKVAKESLKKWCDEKKIPYDSIKLYKFGSIDIPDTHDTENCGLLSQIIDLEV